MGTRLATAGVVSVTKGVTRAVFAEIMVHHDRGLIGSNPRPEIAILYETGLLVSVSRELQGVHVP